MRQIPIPNNTGNIGVELDKTLSDGSKALGVIQVTDTPSPFKPDDILLRINAWQVTPEGRPVNGTALNGQVNQRKIRELVVSVPRAEYSHGVIDQMIPVAAAALEQIVADLPAPIAPLPPIATTPAAPAP